jgi:hypothetical protein
VLPDESGLLSHGDRAALSGTALPRERVAAAANLDREVIAREGLRGEAVTRMEKGSLVLDVELDASCPVEVTVDLDGTGLAARAVSQDGPPGAVVTMEGRTVRIAHPAGRGRYGVSFAPGEPSGRTLKLRVGGGEALELALGREGTP